MVRTNSLRQHKEKKRGLPMDPVVFRVSVDYIPLIKLYSVQELQIKVPSVRMYRMFSVSRL